MYVMFKLHVDLFAGLPGKLFLGFMGLLLLVAIVSGVVLYAPFMRKLEFGEVRRDRSPRVKWLDLHNLLGIVTLVWAFVVGATGMINTWADLLIKYWQYDQLQRAARAVQGPGHRAGGRARPRCSSSLRGGAGACAGHEAVVHRLPRHGLLEPAPQHLLPARQRRRSRRACCSRCWSTPRTAQVTAAPELPWYLTALLVSQPLHFGDYGGMPMKILWALLDIATIIVLGSGLYLWLKRGQPQTLLKEAGVALEGTR